MTLARHFLSARACMSLDVVMNFLKELLVLDGHDDGVEETFVKIMNLLKR